MVILKGERGEERGRERRERGQGGGQSFRAGWRDGGGGRARGGNT